MSTEVELEAVTLNDGVAVELNVSPNVLQHIELNLNTADQLTTDSRFIIEQKVNDHWQELVSSSFSKGVNRLDFLATASLIRWRLAGPFYVKVGTVCVTESVLEQQAVLVDVCDEVKDRYRFGFNGQEKVNEWAGIGNHNTAEFWEYDTRTGRRGNLDPKINASCSFYSTFGDNPILFKDPTGDTVRFMGYKNPDSAPLSVTEAERVYEEMIEFMIENKIDAEYQILNKSKTTYEVWFTQGDKKFMPNMDNEGNFRRGNPKIETNPLQGVKTNIGYILSPLEGFGHELGHAANYELNPCKYFEDAKTRSTNYSFDWVEEENVIMNVEWRNAKKVGNYDLFNGEYTRLDHGAKEPIAVTNWAPLRFQKEWGSMKISTNDNTETGGSDSKTNKDNESSKQSGQKVRLNTGSGNIVDY